MKKGEQVTPFFHARKMHAKKTKFKIYFIHFLGKKVKIVLDKSKLK